MTKNPSIHRTVVMSAQVLTFWACAIIAQQAAAALPAYYITDLGTLGGTDSLGWGLNAHGQVTGYAATAEDATINGFLWTPTTPNGASGTMHDLGTLGGSYAWGIGINDSGLVAGVSATTEDDAEHATLWKPTTPGGSSGTLHDLETLGGTYSQGNGINANGQIAGGSDLTGDDASHAFMWKPTTPGGASGTMHDLGTLGGTFSFAWDINASGQVTGDADTTDDDANHAFLWTPTVPGGATGTMHDLGTLGGAWSDGSGINDLGQVAGSAQTPDDAADHAFLWTPTEPGGTMLDLGTLGGLNSYGYNVNASGHVVGLSEVPIEVSTNSRAFLYKAGSGMVDLNTLIDPLLGWELQDASEINAAGQITGQGLINDEYHAYLLTPVKAGDVNIDGVVNIFDINTVSSNWGTAGPLGDANGDGIVNIFDINLISANWTPTGGGAAAVPEPSSVVLVVVAAAFAAAVCRAAGARRST